MDHGPVELHNVAELRERPDGYLLQRVPESVRTDLNPGAQDAMQRTACTELRTVPDGEVTVTLRAENAEVVTFHGPFQADARRIEGETSLALRRPEELDDLPAIRSGDGFGTAAFDPRVTRLVLRGGPVVLGEVAGAGRPPRDQELPDVRYLTYGTSITHGSAATWPHLSYAGATARRIGADLVNLGSPGSAFCEAAIADHIAGAEWDVASLALSVNMINNGFSVDEFRERAAYLVETVAAAGPVACITLLSFSPDITGGPRPTHESTPAEYRGALREVVASVPDATLVEGRELLDPAGLSPDLLHPGDYGMLGVAERLAPRVRELL
jgi:hypothetical protein